MLRKWVAVVLGFVALLGAGRGLRADVTVAVSPFAVLGDDSRSWVGGAMQEGLQSNLSRQSGVAAVLITPGNPNDPQSVLAAARDAKADFVILGSVQVVENQMRISGELVSTGSGKTITGLRMDGALGDLFVIEDAMAGKALRIVNPVIVASANPSPPTFQLVGPTVPAAGKYFDGNAMETLAPAPQFTDEANHYNYNGSYLNGPYWWGWGYGWYRCGWFPYWGWCGYGGATAVQLGEW
jgi:TolB-like protein